jgi:hypothetical protein
MLYTDPNVFTDSIGQLLSHEDLDVIRDNVANVEALSYRMMPGFASSGGIETGTAGFYNSSNTVHIWYGNLRWFTGMTTLTVEGTATGYGSLSIKVYVNGVLRITIAPGATWSGTWAMSGFADGEVMDLEVRLTTSSGTVSTTAKVVVEAVYGSPVVYAPSWPGTPTFTTAWTAAKINQLNNAIIWLMNRMTAVPIRPDMSSLFGLGPFRDSTVDPTTYRRPMYYGAVVRWYSNSQFRIGGSIWNGSSAGLQMEIEFNGVLVYTSPNYAIGTTVIGFTLPLSSYTIGANIQVGIFLNCTNEGPVGAVAGKYSFPRLTINAARSEVDGSAIYTTLPATPAADPTSIAVATMAAYLNALSTTVLAAYTRINATPGIWNRVWAVRRWFSKTNDWSDTGRGRGRPRFRRQGDRLIVRGKGIDVAWGPLKLENTDRGVDFDGYSFLYTQNVIDSETLETKIVYLENLAGLEYGAPFFLLGDVSWAECRIF